MPENLKPDQWQLAPLPKLPPLNAAPPVAENQWSAGYFQSLIYSAATGKASARDEARIVGSLKKSFPGVSEEDIRKNVHQSVEEANASVGLNRVVVIILGLLLIAAGIFSFKTARETIITTVKGATSV